MGPVLMNLDHTWEPVLVYVLRSWLNIDGTNGTVKFTRGFQRFPDNLSLTNHNVYYPKMTISEH